MNEGVNNRAGTARPVAAQLTKQIEREQRRQGHQRRLALAVSDVWSDKEKRRVLLPSDATAVALLIMETERDVAWCAALAQMLSLNDHERTVLDGALSDPRAVDALVGTGSGSSIDLGSKLGRPDGNGRWGLESLSVLLNGGVACCATASPSIPRPALHPLATCALGQLGLLPAGVPTLARIGFLAASFGDRPVVDRVLDALAAIVVASTFGSVVDGVDNSHRLDDVNTACCNTTDSVLSRVFQSVRNGDSGCASVNTVWDALMCGFCFGGQSGHLNQVFRPGHHSANVNDREAVERRLQRAAYDGVSAILWAARSYQPCVRLITRLAKTAVATTVEAEAEAATVARSTPVAGAGMPSVGSASVAMPSLFGGLSSRGPLFRLAERGHLDAVRAVLSAGLSPHERSPCGSTPLLAAAAAGHSAIVRALVVAGAEIDARCPRTGDTALLFAVARGDRLLAEWLLKQGASASVANAQGSTGLHLAVRSGSRDLVGQFVSQMQSTTTRDRIAVSNPCCSGAVDVNATDFNGRSALAIAVRNGSRDLVRTLLAAGANPNIVGRSTAPTPLHIACRSGSLDLAQVLVAHGADPAWRPQPPKRTNVVGKNAADTESGGKRQTSTLRLGSASSQATAAALADGTSSVLCAAVRSRNTELVSFLLALPGPSLTQGPPGEGAEMLTLAAGDRQLEAVLRRAGVARKT